MSGAPVFSYSMLDAFFEVCPESARRQYVTKDKKRSYTKEKEGGIDTHKVIEQRLRYNVALPPELAAVENVIGSLQRYGEIEAEVELAVDHNCNPTKFFGENHRTGTRWPWLRGKYDAVVRSVEIAVMVDWKDGKEREKPDQIEIGALLLFENFPNIKRVIGFNVWLKQNAKMGVVQTFDREKKSALWAKWINRMRAIEALDPRVVWERRAGPLCSWCPVSDCPNYRGG